MEAVDGRSGLADAAGGPGGVAFDFPAGEPEAASAPVKIPRRIRRRLLEGKNSSPPSSVEEIEAKLKEADIRRQQFHEWLSSKARPKPRSPSWSSQEEDLGQRLEAKLNAAEQKRLSLLAKAQMRLARLDELRQAAKTGVEMRFEKEREELGTKVESRVQQAEENRLRLLEAHMQRRAAAQERKARSVLQTAIREKKYKECVRSAIFQKRAAAEKERMKLLEEEKTRAHARVMQVRRVAKSVCHQRESERSRMKEQLENRLQRAKCQRAEYLKQRGSPQSSARITLNKHGDFLSRKLARCWRRFVRSRKTTVALAKAFDTLDINASVVKSIPFDQLALRIQSATTLRTVKALLDRLESRFLLSQSSSSSSLENIDHLLKHLASPNRTTPSGKSTRARGMTKKVLAREIISSESNKLSRYSVRVVLCAYMILGHPYAVFSEHGDREVALRESAANFAREFELLVRIILDGPNNTQLARQSSPEFTSEDWGHHLEKSSQVPRLQTFKSQLATFDAAWRSYLYCFVVWKVKDARSLEEDLVRAACHLELSMMKTCKLTFEGQTCNLSHDMRAIQKQVTEDQKLLREKVQHLSGSEGIERMEYALQDTRSKFFEAQENGSPLEGPVNISSPPVSVSSVLPSASVSEDHSVENNGHSGRVVRSLFGKASPSSSEVGAKNQDVGGSQLSNTNDRQIPSENELLVNEIVHGGHSTLANNVEVADLEGVGVKAKVQETMKKAFWDGIMESMKEDSPDYGRILALVKEVRDELIEMAPQSWKQDIFDSIDLEILSQVFESNAEDTNYLGRIFENVLALLQKLSAPAKENEMKKVHDKLLNELTYIAQSSDKQDSTFVIAIIKGLRFVLEQIQALKKEISKARIQLMEPIIKGSAGLEYLQKAFADRYGPPSDAENSLPLTAKWISSLGNSLQEWNEHVDSLPALPATHGLTPVVALRTGGSISLGQKHSHPLNNSGDGEQPECKGEKIDRLLRVGLLKLASGIEGLTVETAPETLKLNVLRLRSVQSQLQQIIVVSTSMLVLRQILVSEKLVGSPSELENIIYDSLKRLSELLDNVPEVGIEEVVDTITSSSSEAKLQDRKEVMMRVLIKSLQNEDAVFMKVSKAIYLAARAIVFGGSGARGRKLAEAVLSKVGASTLLDRVMKAAEVLIVVATISGHVHGPWYRNLVETNLG